MRPSGEVVHVRRRRLTLHSPDLPSAVGMQREICKPGRFVGCGVWEESVGG
ncbi:hypothetical protein J7K19_12380 [bacterium]|nr:hypothetical protein [bacterium]